MNFNGGNTVVILHFRKIWKENVAVKVSLLIHSFSVADWGKKEAYNNKKKLTRKNYERIIGIAKGGVKKDHQETKGKEVGKEVV